MCDDVLGNYFSVRHTYVLLMALDYITLLLFVMGSFVWSCDNTCRFLVFGTAKFPSKRQGE